MKLYNYILVIITICTVSVVDYVKEVKDLQYQWYIDLAIDFIVLSLVVGVAVLLIRNIRVLKEKELPIGLSLVGVFVLSSVFNMFLF